MRENSDSIFYRSIFFELRRLGYIEGENLVVERLSGEGRIERYAEVARELLRLKPEVIVVNNARILAYIREATTTIPIVAISGDPILFGILSNVSRPEGNVTGFSADASIEIHGKYLEYLQKLKPDLSKVGLLAPRLAWEPYGRPLRAIAERLGVEIIGPPLENPLGAAEFRRVIAAMVDTGANGLLATASAEVSAHRALIVALAERYQLPAIYPSAGAPNVLLILTDDVGFGATGTFGGPIETPNFQRIADNGLRYNMYHTTALCSPTRAALITGRNHHSVASGDITEFATGYPGYNSLVPKSAGSVGAVLKENGYNTAWFGKMHNVPDWMSSQAGPFDLWPNGLGFEHFYGFLGGDSDQWHPALYENTKPVEPYVGKPDYILDVDLADKAITWMQMQHALAPNKPWLMY